MVRIAELADPIWWLRAWMTDNWIESPKADLFFGTCFTVMMLVTIYLYFGLSLHFASLNNLGSLIVGGAAALADLLLWFGMWRFWIRRDRSSAVARRTWFFVLLLGLWYGAGLYYLFVFRPRLKLSQRV